MQSITNFYNFLKQQDIYQNQMTITDSAIPVWEELASESSSFNIEQKSDKPLKSLLKIIGLNSSELNRPQNNLIHLLYSRFGDPEFIGLLDDKYVNFDEETARIFKMNIETLKANNAFKEFDTVEEIWEKVIKPKILEFKV